MTAFLQGRHTYLVPVTPDRGPYGRGRARTYPWPDNAVEVTPVQLANAEVDVVVLQRPEELELAARWLRRVPGRDLPAVYVEHNTPRGQVPDTRHPFADRSDLVVVHVTHFNELYWDTGETPTTVIDHGVPDPGHHYTGELPRLAAVINEPLRRWRVTGSDLLPYFAACAPIDVYGMRGAGLAERLGLSRDQICDRGDVVQSVMHQELAHRRVYLHPHRWTSLGLSLIEAMMLGMPVVGLAATEAVQAVPRDAGVLSTRIDELVEAARWLIEDPRAARAVGMRARAAAVARYSVARFQADWDALLSQVTGLPPAGVSGRWGGNGYADAVVGTDPVSERPH